MLSEPRAALIPGTSEASAIAPSCNCDSLRKCRRVICSSFSNRGSMACPPISFLMKPPPMAVDPNRLCRSGEDLGEKPSLRRQGWPWKVSKFCPLASESACEGNRPDHSSRQHEGATVSRLGCCIRVRTVTRHQLLRAPECPPRGLPETTAYAGGASFEGDAHRLAGPQLRRICRIRSRLDQEHQLRARLVAVDDRRGELRLGRDVSNRDRHLGLAAIAVDV